MNYFDTADVYGAGQTYPGAAEEVLGDVLKEFPRSSYVLATKAFWPVGDGPNDRGLSRKHIVEQCNASLKRLNTDYIDIFYCHRYDPETPVDETLMALDDLVRQGKVLYVGVSEWTAVQIAEGIHTTKNLNLNPIAVNQPSYNMFNRYIEDEVMPLCAGEGIGLAVFSPLAQGVLTGKYRKGEPVPVDSRAADKDTKHHVERYLTDQNLDKVEKLREIAGDLDISLSQLALAWILQKEEISSVIIGATKPEQVEENCKASGVKLSNDIVETIGDILD